MLHHLCTINPSPGALGPALRVCLTFGFFAVLRQLNLVPPSAAQFDPMWPTCRGDIVMAPPGLQILVRWTKTHQSVGQAPVLPIPEVSGHPTDPVAAYRLLLAASPTTSPDQPLLTYLHALGALLHGHCPHPVLSPGHPPPRPWIRHEVLKMKIINYLLNYMTFCGKYTDGILVPSPAFLMKISPDIEIFEV